LRGFLAVVEQDIGELKTSVEELKTSQEQMVRNNSLLVEQVKAAQVIQEKMAGLTVNDPEQQTPIATSAKKPLLKLSSPQTRARPLASGRQRPK
jgi:regulator of replication initiation timing